MVGILIKLVIVPQRILFERSRPTSACRHGLYEQQRQPPAFIIQYQGMIPNAKMDSTASSPISLNDVFRGGSTPPTSIPPSPSSSNICARCGGSATFPSTLQSQGLSPQSEVVNSVNEALKGKPPRAPYTKVSVLLLGWDVQHQGWDREVADLRNVFEDFNFTIFQDHKISLDEYAEDELMGLVSGFIRQCGGPESLLIIYYTGHGGVASDGGCLWGA